MHGLCVGVCLCMNTPGFLLMIVSLKHIHPPLSLPMTVELVSVSVLMSFKWHHQQFNCDSKVLCH